MPDAPAPSLAALTPPRPPYLVTRFDGHTHPSPDTEWLLTLGNGGYAMGTAGLVARRKYHALLIASTRPPVDRLAVLGALDETVVVGATAAAPLYSHRHVSGRLSPEGWRSLRRFEKDVDGCRWIYEVGPVQITKELRLGWRRNICAVRYLVRSEASDVRIVIAPRVALRDFHATLPRVDPERYRVEAPAGDAGRTMRVSAEAFGREQCAAIACSAGWIDPGASVIPGIRLDFETERHQEDEDSLFTPGQFVIEVGKGESQFTISAALAPDEPDLALFDRTERAERRAEARRRFVAVNPRREALTPLVDAAEDFLATRPSGGRMLTTVLAGFPWFADWGRDTMISMVGLLIVSGRFEEARDALAAFAAHVSEGMIPNLFSDYGGEPEYNTVDASLWFLHACCEYRRASGDREGFEQFCLPACKQIIERYQSGTRYGIRMDPEDGLIMAGDESTQLTWMDARRNGVVFTPRHGKAVEINALWYHGLLSVAGAIEGNDASRAKALRELAARVGESIRAKFWNARGACLFDCLRSPSALDRSWAPIAEIRPNQIFAVSLANSALRPEQARAVVECVRSRLLTPFGLRTLAPDDPKYQPYFDGDMMSRDRAYHNGTVWPWLIGAYCEALLRAHEFSTAARDQARQALAPLMQSMASGCLGQIAEIYEAEGRNGAAQREQACIAQAWSVAEVLRAAALIEEGPATG
jgi:predicted glycogen debranching enzyme